MSRENKVALIYDDAMLGHAPDGYDPQRPEWTEMVKKRLGELDEGGMKFTHPERPERLQAVLDSFEDVPVDCCEWLTAEPAPRERQALVHTEEYLDHIESFRGKSGWLHHDTTAVSEHSVHAADVAVGAACRAVDEVMSGAHRRAFALVRPPGHHTHAGKARGFCLYNNVAIAAEHARRTHGIERVLIVDWDAHHGDGTQSIVAADPDIMHFDIHAGAPVYPGTGALYETGAEPAVGTLINVPLPPKSGDAVVLEALDAILAPAALRFRPDLILVSAGFDGHQADLLFTQTEAGFAAQTARLLELAELLTDGRIAFVLEGGYREALSVSVRACVEVLAGAEPPEIELGAEDPGRSDLRLAANFHNRPIYY